jgi:squalene-hopene/tetraprenyl-beta-curcumene cyclase
MRQMLVLAGSVCLVAAVGSGVTATPESAPAWNARAAAAYLDQRADWWVKWPTAARDHGTSCVSCHTALPYMLARGSLRRSFGETSPAPAEQAILANVEKRTTAWRDMEPFYPDQTRGLPKSSESRGTEAILNALILAERDRQTGQLGTDTRSAFSNMWALQFKAGTLKGAWAWLDFHLEPWESTNAGYFGASLGALAVGIAPGDYAADASIQPALGELRTFLRNRFDSESLFNRMTVLWAASALHELLTPAQETDAASAVLRIQQPDGGWSTASLGGWQRQDGTPLESGSDGFATGLVVVAMRHASAAPAADAVQRAKAWLLGHQDASGAWTASSLNKKRDPATDAGKFMTDAATAFAVLALSDR